MKRYLMVGEWETEGDDVRLMTADEIFRMMDMADCFPEEFHFDLWRVNGRGEALTECSFAGKWHDPSDPLKMVIVGGGEKEVGYGTDH